jgi:hypothetical protein
MMKNPKYLTWPIPLKPELYINKHPKTSTIVHHIAGMQRDGRNNSGSHRMLKTDCNNFTMMTQLSSSVSHDEVSSMMF